MTARAAVAFVLALALAASPGAADDDGLTPLHEAARDSDVAAIEALINARADPNARSLSGVTPLHMAAWINANPAVVDALLDAGANPKAEIEGGFTPFDWAKDNEALKGTAAYWHLYEAQFQ